MSQQNKKSTKNTRTFTVPVPGQKQWPVITAKVDKTGGEFHYMVNLTILQKGENVEVVRCDNFHRDHHIHHFSKNGKEKIKKFNFETLGKTVDYMLVNSRKFIESYEENIK